MNKCMTNFRFQVFIYFNRCEEGSGAIIIIAMLHYSLLHNACIIVYNHCSSMKVLFYMYVRLSEVISEVLVHKSRKYYYALYGSHLTEHGITQAG